MSESTETVLPIWRQLQKKNFIHWEKLADFLELTPTQRQEVLPRPHFPLNLPFRLAEKIQKGTLDDPILKQFLPTQKENVKTPGFILDPVADTTFRQEAKLLKKYQGRALLVTTSACVMNCRFCFRQNFPYEVSYPSFEKEIAAIAEDPSIHEIILSGGDPLSLSDATLGGLLKELGAISHLKRIRFHTRFPIGIPERITESFLQLLKSIPQQIWFVIHCNHPRELDEDIFAHLRKLQHQGVLVANQWVLLRVINDDADTLRELCEVLVDHGIVPYYLHQLDRVQGAAHFEVPEEEGRALIEEVSCRLPGYAIPRYVREIPGEPFKTPLI